MSPKPVFMPWVDRLPDVGEAALFRRGEVYQLVREAAALERQAVTLMAQARGGQAEFLAEVMQRWTVAEIQSAALQTDPGDPAFLARAQVEDPPLRQRLFRLDGSHLASEALQAFQGAQVIRQHNLLSSASDEDRRQTLARVLAWWNHAARPVCERLSASA